MIKITKIHRPDKHLVVYFDYDDNCYGLTNFMDNNEDLNPIGVQLRKKRFSFPNGGDNEYECQFESPSIRVPGITLQDLFKEELKEGIVYSQIDIDYFANKLEEYGFMNELKKDQL